MDLGAWWATVHGVTKSRTQLTSERILAHGAVSLLVDGFDMWRVCHIEQLLLPNLISPLTENKVQLLSHVQLFRPHGHVSLPCPSLSPRVDSNSCPLSRWCHPAISSSVTAFSSCFQSSPASGSFPMNQFFASGGQSIGASASASVLPVNIQGWFHFGLPGLISLQSKGLSRVFSNTIVQKHQFFVKHKAKGIFDYSFISSQLALIRLFLCIRLWVKFWRSSDE